jgi:hypothetical protein
VTKQADLFGEAVEKHSMNQIIGSVSYSQDEIMKGIIALYCPNGFELDPTYSKGNFYKVIPQPKFKSDLVPQCEGVALRDCRTLLFENDSLESIMFDPPFVGGSQADGLPGIIKTRFGYFKNIPELWEFYTQSMREFYRVLKDGGILIFKCQDSVESGKQYLSHVYIINEAVKIGFYPEDIFILVTDTRLISPNQFNQKHCRKFHSYFVVLKKEAL